MLWFEVQHDEIEIPAERKRQEAILQAIRDSHARPLLLRGDNRMSPITPPTNVERNEVVPFKKRPVPTSPGRTSPAEPLRPAAIKKIDHNHPGDRLRALIK